MKVKVTYMLKSKEEDLFLETIGIQRENELIFKDHDVTFKITLSNPMVFKRTSKEYEWMINLDTKKGYYQINRLGTFWLQLKNLDIQSSETNLEVRYHLIMDHEDIGEFELNLNYEVIQ